jgi:hypothetical protein
VPIGEEIEDLEDKVENDFESLTKDQLNTLYKHYGSIRQDIRSGQYLQDPGKRTQAIYNSYVAQAVLVLSAAAAATDSEVAQEFLNQRRADFYELEERRREFLSKNTSIKRDDEIEREYEQRKEREKQKAAEVKSAVRSVQPPVDALSVADRSAPTAPRMPPPPPGRVDPLRDFEGVEFHSALSGARPTLRRVADDASSRSSTALSESLRHAVVDIPPIRGSRTYDSSSRASSNGDDEHGATASRPHVAVDVASSHGSSLGDEEEVVVSPRSSDMSSQRVPPPPGRNSPLTPTRSNLTAEALEELQRQQESLVSAVTRQRPLSREDARRDRDDAEETHSQASSSVEEWLAQTQPLRAEALERGQQSLNREEFYGEVKVFTVPGGKNGYLDKIIQDHFEGDYQGNIKLNKEEYQTFSSGIHERMSNDFQNGVLKVVEPVPVNQKISQYNIKGKTLEEIENADGTINFKAEEGLNGVVRVQRRDQKGELIAAYDTIEYQDGKVSRLIVGGEGLSRLGDIGLPKERGVIVAGEMSPEEQARFASMSTSRDSERTSRDPLPPQQHLPVDTHLHASRDQERSGFNPSRSHSPVVESLPLLRAALVGEADATTTLRPGSTPRGNSPVRVYKPGQSHR